MFASFGAFPGNPKLIALQQPSDCQARLAAYDAIPTFLRRLHRLLCFVDLQVPDKQMPLNTSVTGLSASTFFYAALQVTVTRRDVARHFL